MGELSKEAREKILEFVLSGDCPVHMLPVYKWWLQRRPEQICPDPPPTIYFLLGGRGSGKTFTASNHIYEYCVSLPYTPENSVIYVALVGSTFEDVKNTMVEGMALALDTLVATPAGMTEIGSIKTGDIVYGGNGNPCNVTAAWPILYNRTCYEVTFKGGIKIVADANHKWVTETYKARAYSKRAKNTSFIPSVVTTEEIYQTLRHYSGKNSQSNHAIKTSFIPGSDLEIELPLDPYLFGVWLGDGKSNGAEITTMDPEIVESFALAGFEPRKYTAPYQWGFIGLSKILNNMGSYTTKSKKTVPEIYFQGSYKQRLALLQGLMDTDGTITARGQCEFSNSNILLHEAVIKLACSLGIKASTPRIKNEEGVMHKFPGDKMYSINKSWVTKFTTVLPVFRLPRKLKRIPTNYRDSDYWFISDIQPIDPVPVRCITVDSSDNTYLITNHLIKTHNSGLLNIIPEENLIAWNRTVGELKFFVREDDNYREVRANTYTSERPEKLRGPNTHVAWLDEMAKFKDADIDPEKASTTFSNMMMGLRLGTKPHVIVTGTPTPCKLVRYILEHPDMKLSHMTTLDNIDNLPESFVAEFTRLRKDSRTYRQEVMAEVLLDNPDAIFSRSVIDENRSPVPYDEKVIKVLGYDPSVSSSADSDECGIVLCAYTPEVKQVTKITGGRPIVIKPIHAYLLKDFSGHYTPSEQVKLVIKTVLQEGVDDLVFEQNQGVEFVMSSLEQAIKDTTIEYRVAKSRKAKKTDYGVVKKWTISGVDRTDRPFKFNIYAIHAISGKKLRAEMVSTRYDSNQVHHPKTSLPTCEISSCNANLEVQMVSWSPNTTRLSPDRLDAMVYCLLHIFSGNIITNRKVTIARPPDIDMNQSMSQHDAVKKHRGYASIYSADIESGNPSDVADRSLMPRLLSGRDSSWFNPYDRNIG